MDFVLERLYTRDKIVLDKRGQSYTCGRGKENEIVCLSLLVSRRHCIFFHGTEKLYVTDLESSNGIFINGMIQKPRQMVELHEHDIIGIGCSEINSDEPALYVYKVCGLKTSFAAEEANSSLLSRTILNCDTMQKKSASSKQHLEKECGSTSHTNCDTVVPCNISRGINSKTHISNVNLSGETNTHISDDNQNPHGNNTDNFVETKSMEVEDDIEIIHMSCKKETKDWDAEQYNLKYEESVTNNNKSNFNGKEIQHYKKSQIKVEKTDKEMDTAIDGIGKYDNNTDAKRSRITKQVSGDLGETSSAQKNQTFTKEPNFIYNNDQIIKLEDELQITDDEETHASSKMICDTSPIRLKKIKQEPTTRFSEIDVVDLSDNEDGIFPYSQLFDIKFEDDTKSKMEIKKECVNDDTEKVSLLDVDDEVIILTDSEDEDNPWLHRLSRSQLVNEDKKREMSDVIIKDEIDLGIWEDDDISNIIESGVPHTSKDVKNIIDTQPIDTDATTVCVPKKTSVELCISVNDKTESETNSGANLLTTKMDMMDVDNIVSSNEPDSRNGDHTNKQKAHVKEDTEVEKQTKAPNDTSSRISVRKRAIKSATTNERLIPVIEPHILLKKRRSNKDLIKDCNKEHSKDRSTDNNKASKSSEDKSSSKLTTEEDGMLKLKEKLDSHFYSKEQKHGAKSSKKAADVSLSSKTKSIASISKEKRKMIVEERKMKLKKIAEEEKEKSSAEGDKTIKRGTAKPRAKVSLKNRGDFLINEQETHVSKRLPDKVAEQALSGSSKSTIHLTDKTNQLKEPVSNVEMNKSHKRQIDQDSISNVAESLQQSLNLDNIPETVKICKKNGSTKDFDTTTNDIEKECSISEKKKKSDKNAVKVREEKICELQQTIDEYTAISIQKNNSSSNSTKSKTVARLKKKEVTFAEKVEIKEYEIDMHNSLKRLEGKDAPIPTNKLKVKVNCIKWKPKLEEFLLCIFMWNPVWLEEQRYLKSEPPIVKENELQHMKLHYDSFQQYYKVAQPLLLHEIWHILTKDFEMVENNMQRVTAMCYIVANTITRIPIPSTDSFLTTLMIEVLVGKKDVDKQTHPNYGDLVIFEYVRDKNVRGKQKFQKLFAYITNVHQTVISDFTHYNKDLRNYVKNPYAVITYTMLTRSLDSDIIFNRVQRIRTVTYLRASMRMVQALQYLPQSPLSQLIVDPRIENYQLPPMDTSYTCSSLVTKDQLNAKQLEAVFRVTQTVLRKESKLCFIQGPPGTGKSKVIVNLVTQIYTENDAKNNKKFRILICAPSNAAIDEIVTRLLVIRSNLKTKRFNMVRIGRPETMHPSAKNISVTELAKRYLKKMADKGVRLLYENTASLREEKAQLEAEINSLQAKLANAINVSDASIKETKRDFIDVSTKYQLLIGGKSIDQINIQDRVRYQRSAEDTILAGADIIACTLSSCYTKQMESIFGANKQSLPVCIVDEATQSCEAETLIPLMLGVNTLVLVGDPNQLPATILSQRAKKLGLDQSIFSRIQCAFESQTNNPIIMLNTQYRMAYDISYWPNKYFYSGQLKNSAENRQTFPFHPYRVLSHSFAQNDDKFTNTTEAEFVANIIFAMLMFTKWENTNGGPISLGVLTPYNNQRTMVLSKIQEKISTVPDNIKKKINFEVNTVDSFQGQERDIIIMSCVRSQGIGFLSDKQRLCVALTRAKYSLILCGNFNTFRRDHMWNVLLSDARDRGVLCNINANATPAAIKKFIIL